MRRGKAKSGHADGAGAGRPAVDAVVGLGANLGDTVAALTAAREALAALPATLLVKASSLYRTAPVGYSDQPDFLNAVCWFKTGLGPWAFAEAVFALERDLGRVRTGVRNGPRVIDIDLLYFGGACEPGPILQLPHPRFHERAFVLYPWREIMPDFGVPGVGRIADLCAAVQDQRTERLEMRW